MSGNNGCMPLSQIRPGGRCIVRQILASHTSGRMYDMGVLPETELQLVRQAPLAGPIALRLRGFCLSLRRSEADTILVEEVS